MLKLALNILTLWILSSTQLFGQASKVDSSEMRILRIDPSNAKGASVSQLFEEVRFVPLETNKESLFGYISQLRVTDDRYIIFDNDTKSILIFNKDGKYKAKINGSKIEKNPDGGSNQNFNGFNLRTENGQQLIRITVGNYNHYFDLNAQLVRKVKGEGYISPDQFSDGTIVDPTYVEKTGKDSTHFELSLMKNGKKSSSYFPYSLEAYKKEEFFTGGQSILDYGVSNELFYLRPYEYNIYKVTPEKLSLTYSIFFPSKNSLPTDFMTNRDYIGKRKGFLQTNPYVFFGLGSTYKIGENLFFKAANWGWGYDVKTAFIYNLKSKDLVSVSDLEPDSLSQYLPVTDAGVGGEFSDKGFLWFDQNYFYTTYSSLVLFALKEQNAGNTRKYDAVLTAYFKTQNRKSNPVIIQLRPKKS